MIKNLFLLFFFIAPCSFSAVIEFCTKNPDCGFSVVQATMNHLEPLLGLIAAIPSDSEDKKKIVIFPERFRKDIVKNDIEKEKLFVALDDQNKVIGYKKLFILQAPALQEILVDEIRCLGDRRQKVDSFSLHDVDTIMKKESFQEDILPDDFFNTYPVFYTGSDYVDAQFRGKGVCSVLYQYSIKTVMENYKNLLSKKYVLVVYGLVKSNDYASDGSGKSRTSSIAKEFYNCLSMYVRVLSISLARYRAYMPCFDDQGKIDNNESIPGYGNVLCFKLDGSARDNNS